MTINNNVLYVSDNIGYIYALDYKKKNYCGQKILKSLLDQILKFFQI